MELNISSLDFDEFQIVGDARVNEEVIRLIINVIYGLIFVVGFLANVFVVIIIAFCLDIRCPTNIYVINLAIADLLFLMTLPLVMARSVIREWIWGLLLCKLYFIGSTVNQFGAVAFLTALAFDRYIAICWSSKSRVLRSPVFAWILSAVCWGAVTALLTPVFKFASLMHFEGSENHTDTQCSIVWPIGELDDNETTPTASRKIFTLYMGITGYIVPLLLIWSLYSCVLRELSRHNSVNVQNPRHKRRHRKVTIMVLSVILAYTLCWLPFWMLQTFIELASFELINGLGTWLIILSNVAYGVQFSNAILNPILYCFVSDSHQKAVVTAFSRGKIRRLYGSHNRDPLVNPDMTRTKLGKMPGTQAMTKPKGTLEMVEVVEKHLLL